MPDLVFQVEAAAAVPFAAAPTLAFQLHLTNLGDEAIHTVALRCQIQIEATRRAYSPAEQAELRDLFGEPQRWQQTLHRMLWTHAGAVVPAFTRETRVELPIACTFDFNIAIVKYLHGIKEGEIPLCFQFSGTVFYQDGEQLQVAPISWDKEARFRLPVATWNGMIDQYYPNSAWLYLRRDVFERLHQVKIQRGIPTWEQTLEALL